MFDRVQWLTTDRDGLILQGAYAMVETTRSQSPEGLPQTYMGRYVLYLNSVIAKFVYSITVCEPFFRINSFQDLPDPGEPSNSTLVRISEFILS